MSIARIKKSFGLKPSQKANTTTSQNVSLDAKIKKIISYPSLKLFPSDSPRKNHRLNNFFSTLKL